MTITILPPAKTQFSDSNGVPLASGTVAMYVPNTSTPKTTWQDAGGTIPNANPIILDASGECLLFGSGAYRQVVQDSLGNTIWDSETLDPGYAIMATFNGTSTTSVAIGTGSKTFTTQPGLQFFPGGIVNIVSNASALNYMNSTVTSYDATTGVLVVTVLQDGGSGTHADWNIAVSGIQGPPGLVTAISVASANGFTGASSGGGTPQLTLATSVTGVVKGNGTALSAATPSVDYIVPNTGSAIVNEAMLNLNNNTTANVSISKHGFAPILPNNATLFLNGVGGYSIPAGGTIIGTSTTSLNIATGSTTFTTQSGLTLGAGQYVIIPSNANAANYFFGQVTSYSGTTLVVNVTATSGSGTHTDWNILPSGPPGPSGGGVTTISVVSANGLAGTVASPTTTPAITLSTSITGVLKGNGTAISAATAGTDYVTANSTNTLTNKTYDTAGTGNVLKISGTQITAISGNTSTVATTTGALTSGHVATFDASGNIQDGGGAVIAVIVPQVFTSTGTYTPTAGMVYCIVEGVGAGAGGGGGAAAVGTGSGGGGGGAGCYGRVTLSAAAVGASQTVTIGSGGGGGASNNTGGTGGTTSLGTLLSCLGGNGGNATATAVTLGGNGGASTGAGDFKIQGQPGTNGFTGAIGQCGVGGSGIFGGGGVGQSTSGSNVNGENAVGYGAGGGGGIGSGSGGNGANGVIYITEYCT